MSPTAAIALTATSIAAAVILTRLTSRGLEWLLATALEHRDELVSRALDDTFDREYRILTAHHPDGDTCTECGSPWPCIPARALGIGTEAP